MLAQSCDNVHTNTYLPTYQLRNELAPVAYEYLQQEQETACVRVDAIYTNDLDIERD